MAGIGIEHVTKRFGGVTAVEATFLGNIVDCHAALADGTRVRIQVDPGQTPEVGQCVGIRFDGRQSSVFG